MSNVTERLKQYGIREDVDFYEYVGKMEELISLLEMLASQSAEKKSFLSDDIAEALTLATEIRNVRLDHFNFLVENDIPVEIDIPTRNGTPYTEIMEKMDTLSIKHVRDVNDLIEKNDLHSAETWLNQLLSKLNTSLHSDTKLCNAIKNAFLKSKASHELNTTELSVSNIGLSDPIPEAVEPDSIVPPGDLRYNGFGKFYDGRFHSDIRPEDYNNPQTQVPDFMQMPPYNPNFVQYQQNSPFVQADAYRQVPPRKAPPVMRRVNPNPIEQIMSVHEIKRKQPKSFRQKLAKRAGPLLLATGLIASGFLGAHIYNEANPKKIYPYYTPPNPVTATINNTSTTPSILDNVEYTPTVDPFAQITPNTAPTPTATSYTTPTPSSPSKYTYNTPYGKGTLAHSLQFLDADFREVVEQSISSSNDMLSGVHTNIYGIPEGDVGTACRILDNRAQSLYSLNGNRFAIAPQMLELSGASAKYLIAEAIGESGKYKKSEYSPDEIDIYYTICNGKTRSFEIRTIKIVDGKRVVDEVIGRDCHFKGPFKKLITSYCELDAALNGNHTDLATGRTTKCAFGTQEGTVIHTASRDAYDSLVYIYQYPELKVNRRGKGLVLVDKDVNVDTNKDNDNDR